MLLFHSFFLIFLQIKVGGVSVNPVSYRKNIAYVMQDDFLMPTATPREAFAFSATLRLHSRWTQEQIKIKVESLLKALGIEDCADTIVGGEMIKGLSGGQRKRTAHYYIYIIILFAIFAGFRIAGAFVLSQKAKRFY
jgi:ABC-type nitrate/sulfonate/bicarbonate transport system ATPase subunit